MSTSSSQIQEADREHRIGAKNSETMLPAVPNVGLHASQRNVAMLQRCWAPHEGPSRRAHNLTRKLDTVVILLSPSPD